LSRISKKDLLKISAGELRVAAKASAKEEGNLFYSHLRARIREEQSAVKANGCS
jgi:hypothetical protein